MTEKNARQGDKKDERQGQRPKPLDPSSTLLAFQEAFSTHDFPVPTVPGAGRSGRPFAVPLSVHPMR